MNDIPNTLVLDNGSHNIKAGYYDEQQPKVIPNYITRTKYTKRVYVADLYDHTTDLSGLYFRSAFERGYLVNWDSQLTIWDRVFSDDVLKCNPQETKLVVTEPIFNLPRIQKTMDEIMFEEYMFPSVCRTTAPVLTIQTADSRPDCVMVVDCGHAFTHFVPFCYGSPVSSAIRRLDIGGKHLTNKLKETVSFRYWDMMDETYIINAVKESTCFVSKDLEKDLNITKKHKNIYTLDYVLPNFVNSKTGYIKNSNARQVHDPDEEQVLLMNNERFTIPEILFNPSDIGIDQAGIPECIKQSIEACPEDMQELLYANIIVVGGTSRLPGFGERLENELRRLTPIYCDVRVKVTSDPDMQAWKGGKQLCETAALDKDSKSGSGITRPAFISRTEYAEFGPDHFVQ